jgi:leader peptidase (prepilin peptidase) / N-methyltransferase
MFCPDAFLSLFAEKHMPRRKLRRPNWPYLLAVSGILLLILAYLVLQTVAGAHSSGRRGDPNDWWLAFVAASIDAMLATWFAAVGASIGSFLNVVAFRLPLGRHVGGHSGCFYCQTPIAGSDNIPVLAWLRLRGRCRTCRLPISVQYPLVELGVAVIFLVIYLVELRTGGANLPGAEGDHSHGLLQLSLTSPVVERVASYLFVLAGLIGGALIAVRRQEVPLKLYMWLLGPWVIVALIQPDVIVVDWRQAELSGVTQRLDALASILCGLVAALALGRMLLPISFPGADPRLLAGDFETGQARHFLGAMAIAGSVVGWQGVVSLGWCTLLTAVPLAWVLKRFYPRLEFSDPTVWLWLGLLIFRTIWINLQELQIFPASWPVVIGQVSGALLLAPMAWLLRHQRPLPLDP